MTDDNASDLRPMYATDVIYPGLIVIPGAAGRDRRNSSLASSSTGPSPSAATADDPPADLLVNAVIEIDENGGCSRHDSPDA